MINEESYDKAFHNCEEKRKHSIFIETPVKSGEIWNDYSVGFCSKCGCTLLERTLDNQHYGVWVNPYNQKILKIMISPVYFNEERQRMELSRQV